MGLGFEDTESRHALRAASAVQPAAGKSAACSREIRSLQPEIRSLPPVRISLRFYF
jgi:hypothetical protein